MQCRLRIWPVVLLAAITANSGDNSARAQLTTRSAVNGRQQVRAVLAAAMADGSLSRMEDDSIYRLGERLLTPEELPGLRRTLDRLAGRQSAPLPSTPKESAEGRPTVRQGSTRTARTGVIASAEEERAENASYDEPAAEDLQPTPEGDRPAAQEQGESPFREEDLLESPELIDGGTLVFQQGYYSAFPGLFAGWQSLSADAWRNLSLYSTVDAFKGPLDLDDRNGNFGLSFALNTSIRLSGRLGVGLQAGTGGVLSNFYGTQFTGSTIRRQNFTTVGLFQHVAFPYGNLKWGFAYDWLNDDYYTTFNMGQWRVKLGYELDPCREAGIWASIPDRGDTARLGSRQTGFTVDRFKPVAQGSLYYRRCWDGGTSTTAWFGLADVPGQFVFGSDARVPLSGRLALVGNFNYILPNATAEVGQDKEMWSVSVGLELTPRWGATYCQARSNSAPLFPLANNGTFAIRRF
jgi:hypothetical protein